MSTSSTSSRSWGKQKSPWTILQGTMLIFGSRGYSDHIVRGYANNRELLDHASRLLAWGLDPAKVNFAMAYFGIGLTLADPKCNTLGCNSSGWGHAGPITRSTGGLLGLPEIQARIRDSHLTPHLLESIGMKSISWDDQWIAYDDSDTLPGKIKLANSLCMGGTGYWGLEFLSASGISTPPAAFTDACGSQHGGSECPEQQCCSKAGWCGKSPYHCAPGCQSGPCSSPPPPPAASAAASPASPAPSPPNPGISTANPGPSPVGPGPSAPNPSPSPTSPRPSAPNPGPSLPNPETAPSNPGPSPPNPGTSAGNPGTSPANPGPSAANPSPSLANPGTSPANPGASPSSAGVNPATSHPGIPPASLSSSGAGPSEPLPTSTKGSGDVYVEPGVWSRPTPTVHCHPPCTIVLPPLTLSSATTVSWPLWTTYLEVGFPVVTSTTLPGGVVTSSTSYTRSIVTTTISIPPVTTSEIQWFNVEVDGTPVPTYYPL